MCSNSFGHRLSRVAECLLVAAMAAVLIRPGLCAEDRSPARAPNVVLILADDLGYGDLGCYGHPRFQTPRLDRMAAEGVRLTQFNCPAPFCAPTRASLMTGRYPFRCRMIANPTPDAGPAADALALPAGEVTLPQVLRGGGYYCGMLGKWHLGHHPGSLPTDRGFHEYFGIPYSNDMRPVQLLEGSQRVEYPVVQTTLTERYTRRAEKFIHDHKDGPFFLYFAHAMPHKPLAPAEDYYGKTRGGLYADVMAELDASVGRVLDALRAAGIDQQTLVLFTSDNGPWFGGSSGGLRGMKGSSWEGGYRVPMIARWPGRIPAGRTSAQLTVMMDLFCTVLDAAGAQMPDDRVLDGRSLLPLLTGAAQTPHDVIFGHAGEKLAAIRDARWKLHLVPGRDIGLKPGPDGKWLDPRAPDGVTILAPFEQYNLDAYPGVKTGVPGAALQLFDLETDPAEQHDVAAQHPEIVARLKAQHAQMQQQVPPDLVPPKRINAPPKPKAKI